MKSLTLKGSNVCAGALPWRGANGTCAARAASAPPRPSRREPQPPEGRQSRRRTVEVGGTDVEHVAEAALAVGDAAGAVFVEVGFVQALVDVGQGAEAVVALDQQRMLGLGQVQAAVAGKDEAPTVRDGGE